MISTLAAILTADKGKVLTVGKRMHYTEMPAKFPGLTKNWLFADWAKIHVNIFMPKPGVCPEALILWAFSQSLTEASHKCVQKR